MKIREKKEKKSLQKTRNHDFFFRFFLTFQSKAIHKMVKYWEDHHQTKIKKENGLMKQRNRDMIVWTFSSAITQKHELVCRAAANKNKENGLMSYRKRDMNFYRFSKISQSKTVHRKIK